MDYKKIYEDIMNFDPKIRLVISILIMTGGTGISSSLVFAQTDFGDLTVTDSSENLVDTPGLESP
ncbi:MAG TPA: hypothetical protein VFS97_10880 [Nitrososphaeraceae archaeon]|nr:hypothetical protein [Nitrososphaeraceae archaeon]